MTGGREIHVTVSWGAWGSRAGKSFTALLGKCLSLQMSSGSYLLTHPS